MKKMILIGRELSVRETENIRQETEAEILCFEGFELPFAERVISLSANEKKEINYQILDEVKNFGDKNINGASVAKHLTIEKSSVWHYHKFRTYFFVRNLNYERAKLAKIDLENRAVQFYCFGESRFLKEEYPNLAFVFPSEKKEKINLFLLFKFFLFLILRGLSSAFFSFCKSDILIYYTERYTPLLDFKNLKSKKGNFLFDYFFSQVNSRLTLMGEVAVPKLKSKDSFELNHNYFRTKESGHPKKNIETIWMRFGFRAFRKAKSEGEKLRAKYVEILSAPLSVNEKLSIRYIQSLHSSSIYYLTRYFAAKLFFRKNKFKVILAADENSPQTKTLLDAAKFYGIKTVGMQHGTMHDLHPAYLYTKEDIQNNIIPDYTLTWGAYWQQFLVEKGNYPKEKVISVGHLRTDIIPRLLSKERGKNKRYKLVFASQPQRDPVLRKRAAFDVFSVAKRFADIELIVKLHPREYDDIDYYRHIAAEAGCLNFRIDKTSDLYELISSCDALITCFSTVGTETVYFQKPLIILDHLLQDIQGYHREGVAFQASNEEDLSDIVSGLKNGTLVINEQAYLLFIEKYSYRIDGQVARRIEEFLSSLTNLGEV